jgi:hypothetical protein
VIGTLEPKLAGAAGFRTCADAVLETAALPLSYAGIWYCLSELNERIRVHGPALYR